MELERIEKLQAWDELCDPQSCQSAPGANTSRAAVKNHYNLI